MEIHGLRFSFKGPLRPCVITPKDDGYTCAKAAIFFSLFLFCLFIPAWCHPFNIFFASVSLQARKTKQKMTSEHISTPFFSVANLYLDANGRLKSFPTSKLTQSTEG